MVEEKNASLDISKEERKEVEKRIRKCFENKTSVFGSSAFAAFTDGASQIAAMFMMNNPYIAGFYALAKTSGPVSGELRSSATTYSSEKMMDNIVNSMSQEYDKMPRVEQKTKNTDQVYEDISIMSRYGADFINTMNRIYTSYAGLALATAPVLLQNPSIASLASAGITMGTSMGVASILSKRRRRATQGEENSINHDRTIKKAYQKQHLANSHWREANRVSAKEEEKIHKKQKNIYGKLGTMLKSAMKHWGFFSVGLGVNIGVGVAAYYGLGDVASLKSVALPIMSSTLMFSAASSYVNAAGDKIRALNMFSNTYQRFKHKEAYNLSYGKEKLSEKDNVIKLTNVAYNLRHSAKDTEKGINSGDRFDAPLFSNDNKEFYLGPGINILGGASGAGKSTLIDLITHGDDVNQGSISFGHYENNGEFIGKNINDLEHGGQWDNVAIAFQKPEMLINATVMEYITGGNPDVDPKLVEEVTKVVRIGRDGIDPDKIMTETNLSEGEKKRIGLAQALIRDLPILILDEPTSGVDPSTSKDIINYLNKIKDKKTIIYTTHNPEELNLLKVTKAIDLDRDNNINTLEFAEKFGTNTRIPSTISEYDLKDKDVLSSYIILSKSRTSKETSPLAETTSSKEPTDQSSKLAELKERREQNKSNLATLKGLSSLSPDRTTPTPTRPTAAPIIPAGKSPTGHSH